LVTTFITGDTTMQMRDACAWLSRPRYGITHLLLFAVAVGVIVRWQYIVHRDQLNAAVLQSKLPDVRVADQGEVPDSDATRGKYDFTGDWFSWNIPVWEKVLSPYKGKAGVRYLEIGAYEGRSAVWMLENVLTNPTASLTAIDIFDGSYERRYHENIERSGSAGKTTTIKGPSQVEARKLPMGILRYHLYPRVPLQRRCARGCRTELEALEAGRPPHLRRLLLGRWLHPRERLRLAHRFPKGSDRCLH
jgi:Methyltransferase domain